MAQFFWFYLTYPGLAFHEWAHYVMCRMFGVPVLDVNLWQGYVKHGSPKTRSASFFIAVAPFLSNTTIAFLCFVAPHYLSEPLSWRVVFYYVGGSLSLHALPSEHDWKNARPEYLIGWLHPFYILALPFILPLTVLYALPRLRRRFLILGLTIALAVGFVKYHASIVQFLQLARRWGRSLF